MIFPSGDCEPPGIPRPPSALRLAKPVWWQALAPGTGAHRRSPLGPQRCLRTRFHDARRLKAPGGGKASRSKGSATLS